MYIELLLGVLISYGDYQLRLDTAQKVCCDGEAINFALQEGATAVNMYIQTLHAIQISSSAAPASASNPQRLISDKPARAG